MTATADAFAPSYIEDTGGGYTYNGASNDPSLAIGGPQYATPGAAEAAWFAANPSYAQYNNASALGPNLSGQPGEGDASTMAPVAATAAGGTATGLPTSADLAADAPLGLQSFGATPTVTPTYATATGYNPTNATAATVDPNAQYGYLQLQEQANAASLAPQFAAQDQTTQDQLAARGISSSGSAADIFNQEKAGQNATLAGMNAPAIQQQAGYTQGDITQNQANQQQVGLTNAGAANTASQYGATATNNVNEFNAGEGTAAAGVNAGYYDQALTGDATTYNNYLSTLEQQGYNTGNEGYTAYLNSFGPNSGVTSGYNGAVGAIGGAASGAYSQSVGAEGQAIGGLFGAAGTAASGGAFAGGGAGAGTAIGAAA